MEETQEAGAMTQIASEGLRMPAQIALWLSRAEGEFTEDYTRKGRGQNDIHVMHYMST